MFVVVCLCSLYQYICMCSAQYSAMKLSDISQVHAHILLLLLSCLTWSAPRTGWDFVHAAISLFPQNKNKNMLGHFLPLPIWPFRQRWPWNSDVHAHISKREKWAYNHCTENTFYLHTLHDMLTKWTLNTCTVLLHFSRQWQFASMPLAVQVRIILVVT